MGMDMKKTDRGIDNKAGWKMLAYTIEDVDNVLAHNVIYEEDRLFIMNMSVLQSSSGKRGRYSRKATSKVAKAHQRSPNKISRVCTLSKEIGRGWEGK